LAGRHSSTPTTNEICRQSQQLRSPPQRMNANYRDLSNLLRNPMPALRG
jgi:hypothetical protein